MMRDDAVRRVLLEIMKVGLLRIRAAGWDGRAAECAVEADHLHNIPGALKSLEPELLRYYFDVERPSFIGRATRVNAFMPLWEELGRLLDDQGTDRE